MLIKQGVDISFAKGLDTKTDPKRVQMGNFLSLKNTVFNKGGLLQKRNGYAQFTSLPNNTASYLTTLNNNLTAVGTSIFAYNSSDATWVTKGSIQPVSVNTLPIIRNNLNQIAADSAVASNGLVCTVYLEENSNTITNKYVIANSSTGQNIIAPSVIPVASGTVSGGMRVFVLGNYFIIAFTNTISGTAHLQYIAVSINNPTIVSVNADLAAANVAAQDLSWDGFVAGSKLYFAYDTTTGGQAVKVAYLTISLVVSAAKTFAGYKSTLMSVTADITNPASPVVYVSFYSSSSSTGYTAVLDANLNLILNPVQIIASGTYLNLTSAAQSGFCQIFREVSNSYAWNNDIPTNYIESVFVTPFLGGPIDSVFSSGASSITVSSVVGLTNSMVVVDNTTPANIAPNTQFTISGSVLALSHNTTGNSASTPGDTLGFAVVSSSKINIRSVGLASKAFIVNGIIYFLTAYQSNYQNTYFLINANSQAANPVITAKLAYSNGGGYLIYGLPNVTVSNSTVAQMPYLFKDLILGVNKDTNPPAGTQTAGIYSQTGINLASFDISTNLPSTASSTQNLTTAEIASNLHLSGGFLWMYDGYLPVEHNFFLWADVDTGTPSNTATWSESGGAIVAKPDGSTNTNAYYYQITYEWTDNQGNAYKSAPSIPIPVTTTGSGTSGSVAFSIPSLRLTYKTSNPIKIVIYRWSVAQQNYFQVTSITSPVLNDTTVDTITFTDTLADASILGNSILYTTGGVVEDVNAPASNLLALFDTRLWLVDAEDQNLLWYSKQVIEATPVEMSDLFTMYIAPTTGSESSTGPISAIFPMDDKLIIFKSSQGILYINGTGPDNTGANSQYSQPIFVTSTVGCTNQRSIVLTPQGLMFQSNKGIWLLDRGLGTTYIGAPVEDLTTGANVVSAVSVPETNQVRFLLDTGITLMYDYFYGEWGSFQGVPGVSSCVYNNLHTFINSGGQAYQESPGLYLDGSNPVLISFKTGPLRLGDLQNYQRSYFFYLLGSYYSPHKLNVSIAYDYDINPSQNDILTPLNYSTPFGSGASQSPYGQGNPYGGPLKLEHFRVFLQRQRCMAFSISLQEIYDGTYDVPAGAGLTLSGINLVMGFKNKFPTLPSNISFG